MALHQVHYIEFDDSCYRGNGCLLVASTLTILVVDRRQCHYPNERKTEKIHYCLSTLQERVYPFYVKQKGQPTSSQERNSKEVNGLFEAIARNDIQAFKDSIQNDEGFLMQKTGETKNSVLHLAARFGHIELLAFIIEVLPDLVSVGNIKGETALHETCRQGNTNVVKLLLEANPYVVGTLNHEMQTAFYVACSYGHVEVVTYMADQPGVLDSEEQEALSPLHVSIAEGYFDIVRTILKGCPRFAWKVDTNGCLPLHIACEKGHLEISRTLLMIDPNLALEFDHYRYTPVHLAAMNGQIKILEELLLCSPKCLESLTGDGETVFHPSVRFNRYGNITLSEHIIKNTTVDVTCRNQRGQTAMDILRQQRRASDIRNMLKSFGGRTSTELLSPNIDEIDSETTTTSESPRVVLEQEFEMLFEGIMHPGSDEYDCEIGMGRTARDDQSMEDFTADGRLKGQSTVGRTTASKVFAICNTAAFFISISIVIFLVSIIPFQRKPLMKLLVVAHKVMWVAVSLMATAYIAAMWIIMPHCEGANWTLEVVISVCAGTMGSVFLFLGVTWTRHWLMKLKWRKQRGKTTEERAQQKALRAHIKAQKRTEDTPEYNSSFSTNSIDGSFEELGYHTY
ncbi:PREDICTED: ankyrin repeat-containing protein At3g12360-like [Fragaria vesca subsp. vesca]